jgi:hypothetical protein
MLCQLTLTEAEERFDDVDRRGPPESPLLPQSQLRGHHASDQKTHRHENRESEAQDSEGIFRFGSCGRIPR